MPNIGDVVSSQFLGKKGRNYYMYISCPSCNSTRWVQVTRKNNIYTPRWNTTCQKCLGALSAKKSPQYNGGYYICKYYFVKLDPSDPYYSMCGENGYVKRSRLVMAKHLGRCLTEDEIVHHKDQNTLNDSIDNLQLVNPSEHASIHNEISQPLPEAVHGCTIGKHKGWYILLPCVDCGKERYVMLTNGIPTSERCHRCAAIKRHKDLGHKMS